MEQLKVKIAGEIALSPDAGASMKKWREVFGISQTELSRHLKITPSTISDYEGNRRKSPGIGVIKRFVDAIVDIDVGKGGELVKRFNEAESATQFFEAVNFPRAVNGDELMRAIKGKAVACEEKLPTVSLYGATLIDSIKVILELPYESFMKIYSTTTQRALLFTNVSTGRSPLVAIRVSPIKPALVILHGLKADKVDKLAIRIAQSEGIPLVATTAEMEEVKAGLKSLGGMEVASA
ncbi:helix-turn-helix domain-containing protein [Candidatus Micrarchaeota archaeon]|nr:helix-turn-helix domain-containing protein [Candidatus Micrarchaeota archaeon]MBI5176652.1 helix-turn-helix domain-containing protein [Candidatus Micrarchaeota archaeon]